MHALTLLASLAVGAPAPLPRPPPSQVACGAWTLDFGGAAGPCRLDPDGSYSWGPAAGVVAYLGVWRWDARTRTLPVVEWLRWEPWREHIWSVVLDRELAGVTEAGTKVKLTRRGGRP